MFHISTFIYLLVCWFVCHKSLSSKYTPDSDQNLSQFAIRVRGGETGGQGAPAAAPAAAATTMILSSRTCGRKTSQVTGYLFLILLSFHFSSSDSLSMIPRHRFPSQHQSQQMSHLYPRDRQQESPAGSENEYQTQQDPQQRPEELWDAGRSRSSSQPDPADSGPYAASDHPIILLRRGRSVQVCGDNLVDTLSLICGGKYNRPEKRTISFVLLGKRPLMSGSELKSSGDRSAESIFLRNVRGVADECCLNSCTMSQLRSYCE